MLTLAFSRIIGFFTVSKSALTSRWKSAPSSCMLGWGTEPATKSSASSLDSTWESTQPPL